MDDDTPIPAEALTSGACAVELRDADGQALVRIEAGRTDRPTSPAPEALIRFVGPVIERLPDLVQGGQQLLQSSIFYTIELKPKLLRGVRDGSLSMMKSLEVPEGMRLNVVVSRAGAWGDTPGRIVGQGSVVRVSPSKVKQMASAGFQVATFVMGQIHLQQINDQLKAIGDVVREILGHLQDEQEGMLLAQADELAEIGARLQRGGLSAEDIRDVWNELKGIAKEAGRMAKVLELGLRRVEDEARRVLGETWLWDRIDEGGDKRKRVARAAHKLADAHRRYQQALYVRLAASELLATLRDDPEAVQRIETVIERARDARERLSASLPSESYRSYAKYESDMKHAALMKAVLGEERGKPSPRDATYIDIPVGSMTHVHNTGPGLSHAVHGWNELEWLGREGLKQLEELSARTDAGIELEVEQGPDGTLTARLVAPKPTSP